MYQVAITGIGIVSSLGIGVEAVAESLRNGRSGVVFDPERKKLGFSCALTGRVVGFDPAAHLSKKQRKTMPDFAIQAHASVMEALAVSGLEPEDIRNESTGLVFGSDSSCLTALEQVELLRERGETKLIGSGYVFRSMTSTITLNLNALLKTRGASWTIASACSSGGHAIGQAADLIALGRQERMICGAAQEINWQAMCSFDGLDAFSSWSGDPAKASRPFDVSRDGLVPSGGACAVILERYDLAKARGAKILGTVRSYGFSSDGADVSVPSPDGLYRAMKQAVAGSGGSPAEIDYVCAHATSTPAGDIVEADSIARLFGDASPAVSSLKSMTGHELWMSGASQAVYSTIMAQYGFMAPNINLEQADGVAARLNILTRCQERPPRRVLCNASGFGGTNACLVLDFSA